MFGFPNRDSRGRPRLVGSAGGCKTPVDPKGRPAFQSPPWSVYGTFSQSYDPQSPVEMAEMRHLQNCYATDNIERSALGKLPPEVFNILLGIVVLQKNHLPNAI